MKKAPSTSPESGPSRLQRPVRAIQYLAHETQAVWQTVATIAHEHSVRAPAVRGVEEVRTSDSIGVRTALFSWVVTIISIAVFASFLIPFQKSFFMNALEAKATSMTESIRQPLIGSVAKDDYSEVVSYCLNTASSDPSVAFFVVTRCDGFSLIHTDASWRVESLGKPWILASTDLKPHGAIDKTDLLEEAVYHYIKPIEYSGVNWGWIHVGLSLDEYHANVAVVYRKTAQVALLCIIIGLGIAIAYARKLVKPIRGLKEAVERVANGELTVSAEILSKDEVASLAHSFNRMTAVLRQTHEDLVESKEDAETASRSKSEFLANMSHEIRTPLNGVVGMLKLLTQTPLEIKQQRFVKQGILSSEALLTVINDVLDFSKIEAGRMEFEKVPFDLRDVVENAVQIFAGKAEEKGIELASLVQSNVPPTLLGDPSRIGQILINLLGNAIKFTDVGEVVLRVRIEDEKDNDVILRFDVSDSGIGISKKQQARIFEPFMQEDSTTTRRFGGTGLGLGISKQLAELMKGCLSVESTAGEGSTFSFIIHLTKGAESDAVEQPAGSIDGIRILLVEDHPVSREIIGYHLAARGGEYETAADGASALELLTQNAESGTPFDLALIDWDMPGMSGIELGQAIRAQAALNKTTLIMLSSVNKVSAQYYRESGFATYLTKPIKQSELYDTILSAMNDEVALEKPVLPMEEMARRNAMLQVNILLADDNPINQEVAQGILALAGYRCDVVYSGREAVEAVTTKEYDLVFMDGMMPDMDGYEATKVIRSMEAGTETHLPIIALTANAMRGDRERCLVAGMDDYLSKPIDPDLMIAMVDKWRGESELLEKRSVPERAPEVEAPEETGGPEEESAQWFDRAALLKRCMNNDALTDKMISSFLTQTASDIAAAAEAAAGPDLEQLSKAAHRIKGASANLSMEKLRHAAQELETAARNGNEPDALLCFEMLQSAYEQTRERIEDQHSEQLAAG